MIRKNLHFGTDIKNSFVTVKVGQPVKISGIEGMPSNVFLFFRFNRNCTICKNRTRAILSPAVDDFVNLGTSRPSLLSSTGLFLTNGTASYFDPFLPEEINFHLSRKFHANGKRSCYDGSLGLFGNEAQTSVP